MTEQTSIVPTEGMLIRPSHKSDGYRTIVKVEWTHKRSLFTDETEEHVKCEFLLIKDGTIIKTPWYPKSKFWFYYSICEE